MLAMTVYEDFYYYADGVYKKTDGSSYEGLHAMKLIGWGLDGADPDEEYFIIQNQWDTTWGDDGYINIHVDEVGISLFGVSCTPDL